MDGICNWFVLTKIFGSNYNLVGSRIYRMIDDPFNRKLSMEFIIGDDVIQPPERWKKWEKVYAKIDFWDVRKLTREIQGTRFIVSDLVVLKETQMVSVKMKDENDNSIEFIFEDARIQTVKPIIMNKDDAGYVVCDT